MSFLRSQGVKEYVGLAADGGVRQKSSKIGRQSFFKQHGQHVTTFTHQMHEKYSCWLGRFVFGQKSAQIGREYFKQQWQHVTTVTMVGGLALRSQGVKEWSAWRPMAGWTKIFTNRTIIILQTTQTTRDNDDNGRPDNIHPQNARKIIVSIRSITSRWSVGLRQISCSDKNQQKSTKIRDIDTLSAFFLPLPLCYQDFFVSLHTKIVKNGI